MRLFVFLVGLLAAVGGGVTINVSGLLPSTTDSDLMQMFRPFGPCTAAYVLRDPLTKQSQGRGVVQMERESDANRAASALRTFERSVSVVRSPTAVKPPQMIPRLGGVRRGHAAVATVEAGVPLRLRRGGIN